MTPSDREPRSWQQLLAAYADGELEAHDRAHVRQWLSAHPDLADRLRDQRDLAPANIEFWAAVAPPSPSADTWNGVWNRIARGTAAPTPPPAPRRSPWWRRGFLAAALALPAIPAAAAAIALAILPTPTAAPPAVSPLHSELDDEIFAVADPEDVQILSVRDRDAGQLIVGEAPFNFTMNLAAAGDVRLDDIQPARDGAMAQVQMGGQEPPMVYFVGTRTP